MLFIWQWVMCFTRAAQYCSNEKHNHFDQKRKWRSSLSLWYSNNKFSYKSDIFLLLSKCCFILIFMNFTVHSDQTQSKGRGRQDYIQSQCRGAISFRVVRRTCCRRREATSESWKFSSVVRAPGRVGEWNSADRQRAAWATRELWRKEPGAALQLLNK